MSVAEEEEEEEEEMPFEPIKVVPSIPQNSFLYLKLSSIAAKK
jgi:hypothetical protein